MAIDITFDFRTDAAGVPRSLDDYLAFCESTIAFVAARNERIRLLGC